MRNVAFLPGFPSFFPWFCVVLKWFRMVLLKKKRRKRAVEGRREVQTIQFAIRDRKETFYFEETPIRRLKELF